MTILEEICKFNENFVKVESEINIVKKAQRTSSSRRG